MAGIIAFGLFFIGCAKTEVAVFVGDGNPEQGFAETPGRTIHRVSGITVAGKVSLL